MFRLVAITGLAVAVGLGCSDGDGSSAPTTAIETTTTTTVEATTTTVPFEIEVKRAAIELLEIRNDVFQHPDVTRVSEYIADTCVCLERERGFIERFESEGLRWTDRPVVPVGLRVTSPLPEAPSLIIVAEQPEAEVVNASGAVVESFEPVSRAVYTLNLVQVGTTYRLNGFETFPDLEQDAVDAIVAEGLP